MKEEKKLLLFQFISRTLNQDDKNCNEKLESLNTQNMLWKFFVVNRKNKNYLD